jgi:hypothetical protein
MSTEIQRPNVQDAKPFWPPGRARLRVDFGVVNGKLTATGVDPDQNPPKVVFTAVIGEDQEAAFLNAVRVGAPGTEVPSNDNSATTPSANTVVVSDPGPQEPKIWRVILQLASLTVKTARPTGT